MDLEPFHSARIGLTAEGRTSTKNILAANCAIECAGEESEAVDKVNRASMKNRYVGMGE